VTIDGKALEVTRFEPAGASGAGDPIVMLHEGLGCVALWKDFPQRLADRTRHAVVAYSRYGYGGSDPFAEPRDVDYMHDEARVVLPELLSALGIERPILFGHSDGASIALLFAGFYPGLPRALILEAPHVFVEEHSIAGITQAARAYREGDLRARLARYHRDVDKTFWGWNDIWLDPRFRSWNIEANAAQVACPALLVQGRDDEYGTEAQLRSIAAAVPAASVHVLERCAHAPHRDQPGRTLDASADFLAGLGG
jgi:pimeloyl-ACP methyl ester carboxylesterase